METNANDEIIEDFSKLTYRQRFAVTEYGYLLSAEDAEVVGKMLGDFQEKDVPAFCQAHGIKVSKSQKTSILDNDHQSDLLKIHALISGVYILIALLGCFSIMMIPYVMFTLLWAAIAILISRLYVT